MTTTEQVAKRVEVDTWIANWLAEDAVRFDKKAADNAEMGSESSTLELLNKFEFAEHMRRRLPVGSFLDKTDVDETGAWKPSTLSLFQVFETGKMLVNAALSHPDATEEFLEQARDEWGPVTDEALDYLSCADEIPRRDPVTNEWV